MLCAFDKRSSVILIPQLVLILIYLFLLNSRHAYQLQLTTPSIYFFASSPQCLINLTCNTIILFNKKNN